MKAKVLAAAAVLGLMCSEAVAQGWGGQQGGARQAPPQGEQVTPPRGEPRFKRPPDSTPPADVRRPPPQTGSGPPPNRPPVVVAPPPRPPVVERPPQFRDPPPRFRDRPPQFRDPPPRVIVRPSPPPIIVAPGQPPVWRYRRPFGWCQAKAARLHEFEARMRMDGFITRREMRIASALRSDLARSCGGGRWAPDRGWYVR